MILAAKGASIDQSNSGNTLVSELQCEFCKKEYDLVSILKHIAKNEPCKLFYGSRFDKMKKAYKSTIKKKRKCKLFGKKNLKMIEEKMRPWQGFLNGKKNIGVKTNKDFNSSNG